MSSVTIPQVIHELCGKLMELGSPDCGSGSCDPLELLQALKCWSVGEDISEDLQQKMRAIKVLLLMSLYKSITWAQFLCRLKSTAVCGGSCCTLNPALSPCSTFSPCSLHLSRYVGGYLVIAMGLPILACFLAIILHSSMG